MTFATDIQGDYAIFDGVETVTYTPPTGSAANAVKGLRRGMTRSDLTVFGSLGVQTNDAVWHLWTSTLSSNEPTAGGTITDASGVIWNVLGVYLGTLDTRWRCLARRKVV